MEDMNNPSHSMGVGQPHHPTNHTRPFFYVQPPTQPYYNMYQWNMNPYGQFGLPPSVIPYGRPYMAPYPYTGMQYPGYVVPQAPMQPVDYSRMFNPHISSATYDVQFRHHYQQQACVRRETACSEVQTDPSDTVHKLIDSLDGLRTSEKPPEDSELNPNSDLGSLNTEMTISSSGMTISSSGMTISSSGNVEEEFSGQGRELELCPLPQRQPQQGKRRQRDSPLPSSVFSDSTVTAVVYAESSQICLEELAKQDCWSLASGVVPIDSSSVHEKESLEESRQQYHSEKCCLNTEEPGIEGQSREHHDPPEDVKHDSGALTQSLELNEASHDHSLDCLAPEQDCDKVLTPSHSASEPKDPVKNLDSKAEDLPYRILRQPCGQVTSDMLDNPLWYVDSAGSSLVPPPQSHLSTLGSAYYYRYYPQVAQERQSVLSPSIDELSSRDELFSTDVEDVDLISGGHVYMGGGKLAEATCDTPDLSGKENVPTQSDPVEERFAACSKTCLSCGLSLAEESSPGKSQGLCHYVEREETDEDALEEDNYNEGGELLSACQVPVKKPHHPNRVPQPSARQFPNSKPKRGCCEDHHEVMCHEEQEHGYLWSFDCCEDHKATVKADQYKGKGGQRKAPFKPSNEKPWREGNVASDQDSWGSSGAKYKPKSWRPYNGSQEQMRPPRRRPFVQQRPRRTDYDDYEESAFSRCQRGRGTTKRRGTRY